VCSWGKGSSIPFVVIQVAVVEGLDECLLSLDDYTYLSDIALTTIPHAPKYEKIQQVLAGEGTRYTLANIQGYINVEAVNVDTASVGPRSEESTCSAVDERSNKHFEPDFAQFPIDGELNERDKSTTRSNKHSEPDFAQFPMDGELNEGDESTTRSNKHSEPDFVQFPMDGELNEGDGSTTRSNKSFEPDFARVPIDGALNEGDRITSVTKYNDSAPAQVQTASATTDNNNDKIMIQNINVTDKVLKLSSLQEIIKIGDIAKLQSEDESLKKCYESLKEGKGGYFESKSILYKIIQTTQMCTK